MSWAPGSIVAHYRLVEKVGEGGMGVVWRAVDTRLGREVALKTLPEEFAREPRRLARFEQEARLLAALNHPGIATLHGIEQADGVPFLTMEFVPGRTLGEPLVGGPPPFDEALPLFVQMVAALRYAHEQGIIHRDLKPANIRVTPDGRVKLLDFGLAKALERTPTAPGSDESPTLTREATRSGVIVGTANYLSPEQLRGLPLDGRSDLFQLGMVFFEVLAGRHPFHGPTPVDIQHAILRSEAPVEALADRAPPEFLRVLAKLLEKEPDYRYPDARALEVDLRTLARDSRSDVSELSAVGVAARRRRRHPGPRVAAGIAAIAAVALGAWWALGDRGAAPAAPARVVPLAHVDARATFPSLSPDGRSVVFTSDRGGNWDLWVALVSGGDPVRITDTPAIESHPAWSPDGSRVAFSRSRADDNRSDLYVMPALGGTARKLVEHGIDPSWSPDGRTIAYSDQVAGWTRIASVSEDGSMPPRALTEIEEGFFHRHPRWTPDGRWIVFTRSAGGASGQLVRVAGGGGSPLGITDPAEHAASKDGVVTADGRWVIHVSDRGGATNLWRVPLAGGPAERITSGPGPDLLPDVSRDGRRIVFVHTAVASRLVAVDIEEGDERVLAALEGGPIWGPALSPDGATIAVARKVAGRPWEIVLVPREGGPARTLVESSSNLLWPRFAPDGRSVLFFTWDADRQRVGRAPLEGSGIEWLTGEAEMAGYPDLAPDGRRLAFVRSKDDVDRVVLRDLGSGEERVVVENATLPAFSPDGARLAVARTRSYSGGIGVVPVDRPGEVRWLTQSGSWPVWTPGGEIAFADQEPGGNQRARIVPPDGGQARPAGRFRWNADHHPFTIDPRSGRWITTNEDVANPRLWLAEFDRP